jgi:hypothetical protein
MGASFLDGPTLSTSSCIGRGRLAGLMIFEENTVYARQHYWREDTWIADSSVEHGSSRQNG